MPQPIIFQNNQLAQGIEGAGTALAQALNTRNERQYQEELKQRQQQQEAQKLQKYGGVVSQAIQKAGGLTAETAPTILQDLLAAGIPGEYLKPYQDLILESQKQQIKQQGADSFLDRIGLGRFKTNQNQSNPSLGTQRQGSITNIQESLNTPIGEEDINIQQDDIGNLTADQITALALSPNKQHNNLADQAIKRQDARQRKFESDRKYFSEGAKETEEYFNKIQRTNPKKELALRSAAQSIQSGEVGMFSPNYLADLLNIPGLRNASGVQLVTAGKENLLSNMDRTSAKAQNIWFEQKLNSIFPMIGQTEEANNMALTFLKGELELDKLQTEEYNKLKEQDLKDDEYINFRTLQNRVFENTKDRENSIMRKTMYKAKEIEESEKDIQQLIKNKNKKVVEGTPLTKRMLKVIMSDFANENGEYTENSLKKGVEKAKKLGYEIPTIEEFSTWQ